MRRPHILLVSDRFPPSVGGIQAAGGELAKSFSRMGFRVSVATGTTLAESCSEYDVFRVDVGDFVNEVFDLSLRIHPHLVFLNGHIQHARYPFPIEKSPFPVVFRSHGIGTSFHLYLNSPPLFGMGFWLSQLYRGVRNSFIGSHLSQEVFLDDRCGFFQNFDVLLARLVHPGNASYIPNSFPSILHIGDNQFRMKYDISTTKPMFLCVANYSDLKGQVDVVRYLRRAAHLDCVFVFIGSTRNDVLHSAERLAHGDSRIKLLCGVPRDDVVDAINNCDAAFLFSTHEQQPLFLSEAMSCGKPWISTNVGSVRKMRGGIVLPRRNERFFVNAVQQLLVPERRRALGTEGKTFWEANYSPEVVYARWKRLLDDVIAGKVKNHY